MSRSVIGAVLAGIIAVLTGTAYWVTTSRLEERIYSDVEQRVAKTQELLISNSSMEMLGLLNHIKALSMDPKFVTALGYSTEEGVEQTDPNPILAEEIFKKFRAGLPVNVTQPDIMAMTDDQGRLIALMDANNPVLKPVTESYLNPAGKIKYPALLASIENQIVTSEIWDYERAGAMKVTVAPILSKEVNTTLGTILVAYAVTAPEARKQQALLGAHVVYFQGGAIRASSFDSGKGQEKTLGVSLFSDGGLAEQALGAKTGLGDIRTIKHNGQTFLATAGRLPRHSSKQLNKNYPAPNAGAMVMISLSKANSSVGIVGMAILTVGLLGMILIFLAISLTSRKILTPLEVIEVGVNDIINGNLDRVFEPVGSDLDGLANALNVMLAKILGRPEPGEEEFDEDGNIIRNKAVLPTQPADPKQAEAELLAAEPLEQYLQRIHKEFSAAQVALGDSSPVHYEGFVKNVHANEANLKQKYNAREVRFKVLSENGKVTLKPIPIT